MYLQYKLLSIFETLTRSLKKNKKKIFFFFAKYEMIKNDQISCTVRTVVQTQKLCNVQYSLADCTVQFIYIPPKKVKNFFEKKINSGRH